MKKILIILIAFVLVISLGFVGLLAYMGMFSEYSVTEEIIGPYKYVYKSHTGPYTETGAIGMEVYNSLLQDDIKTTLGLGVYYDNPATTPADQLRSEMGSIIELQDYAKLATLGDKYTVKNISAIKCMVVRFPIKNTLSYILGPIKVYPIMEDYMLAKGYTSKDGDAGYEFYDMQRNEIIFALPISK